MRSRAHASRSLTVTLALGALLACAGDATAQQWPAFRGPDASGVDAAGQPPLTWDVATGTNVAWSTPIPGLGHSCPVVWDDRIFVTTAVPLPGPGGDAGAAADGTVILKEVGSIPTKARHAWRLYCLDRATGRVRWERTAHEGMPKVKRHAKASQASATPVTDGRHVIAMMGSEGLYAFDMQGAPLWSKDLGRLDVGYVDDKNEEWSPGSSPVIHDGLVIVQNDRHADSYVAAFDVATGEVAWRLERGSPYTTTPLVYQGVLYVLVDNGVLSAYDARSGRRFYQQRLARDAGGFSASPVAAAGRVYLASEDGVMFVVRAGRTYELLARNDMREMLLASPAIAGDTLLVRTRTHVVALSGTPRRTASR